MSRDRRGVRCELTVPPSPRFWMTCVLAALTFACSMLASQPAASAEEPAIVISRPKHDETIHDNTGAVPVAVALQGIAFAAGSRLLRNMDIYAVQHHGPLSRPGTGEGVSFHS